MIDEDLTFAALVDALVQNFNYTPTQATSIARDKLDDIVVSMYTTFDNEVEILLEKEPPECI